MCTLDVDGTNVIDPSCNTDKGVNQWCEFYNGSSYDSEMKVNESGSGSLSLYGEAAKKIVTFETLIVSSGFIRAPLIGPERCVTFTSSGRSQRKLWWKAEAVLTCKSLV